MTSRGFTIAIVFVAVAIGMRRAPCSAAPAVSTQSIDIAERAEIRRAGSGSDFFQFPAYFPASEGNDPGVAVAPRTPRSHHDLPAIGGQRRAGEEAGIVGDQEQDAARDLLRLAEAADRDERQDGFLQQVLRRSARSSLGRRWR